MNLVTEGFNLILLQRIHEGVANRWQLGQKRQNMYIYCAEMACVIRFISRLLLSRNSTAVVTIHL